jgi:hypothetical protein
VEEQDDCTAACQLGANRNYAVLTPTVKKGKACAGPLDCKAGEGACPTISPAPIASDGTANTDIITTTNQPTSLNTATTTTTVTADASATDQSSSAGSIVGIVIGVLMLLLLIIGALLYFRKKKQDQTALQALKVRLRALVCPKTKLIWLHRRLN